MDTSAAAFVEFLIAQQALQFGSFTLKSGRTSPYFFNAGRFNTGAAIARLGEFYAGCLAAHWHDQVDVVFGPAYKGVPLAVATAAGFAKDHGRDIGWTFDRKEEKTHGDAGRFVGHALAAGTRVVIVDDVLTTGGAKREALEKLSGTGAQILGVVIALDRQEAGADGRSAVAAFAEESGVPVHAIATVADVIDTLANDPAHAGTVQAMREYLATHGAS